MVAKQSSSLVLETEGQVMAERPKNNCCFAPPDHARERDTTTFFSEAAWSVQNSYKEHL